MMKEVIVRYDEKAFFGVEVGEIVCDLVRCGDCIYWKNSLCRAWHRVIPKDGFCSIGESQTITQTETQNSNLTFEKRTMRDCYNCKRYETEDECIECRYEPKDEPQTERRE